VNILLIYNLGGPERDFYGESLGRAWEEQGHKVIRVLHTEVNDTWASSLRYSPIPMDFMFHSYNSIPLTSVDILGEFLPTVLWIYDEPYEYGKTRMETPHYSISLNATYRPNIKDHNDLGANMYFLPQGVDIGTYRPIELTAQDMDVYGSDISFIGTLDSRRGDRVELRELLQGYGCKFWGPGSTEWVGPEECNRIYSASKIMISPSAASSLNADDESRNDVVGEYTCRVYNTAAARAFQLVEAKADTYGPYIEGYELVTYTGLDELRRKIDHYLQHDGIRMAVAREAYLRTIREHSMYHRARSITDMVQLYKDGKLEADRRDL